MTKHHRIPLTILIAAIAVLLPFIPSRVSGQSYRAIVLAWDGTVPAFAREMLRQGKLPNLAKLIEGGAIADDVIPVFPSKTAPGFASLITGAPPRITGISGNRVPRAPRSQFTILESLAGFSAAPLAACASAVQAIAQSPAAKRNARTCAATRGVISRHPPLGMR